MPAALLSMPGLWSRFDIASEARPISNHAAYDGEIAALPGPIGQRRARWDWGGSTSGVTGGELCSLVYDEEDSLPARLRSGVPWPSSDPPWLDPDRWEPKAERLQGHFHLVVESVP